MKRTQLKHRARVSMVWARPGVLMLCMSYWVIRLVIDWFTAIEIPLVDGVPVLSALWADGRAIALLALSLMVTVAVQALITGHDYLYPLRLSRDITAGFKTFFEPAGQPWRFIALPLFVKALSLLPLLPAAALAAVNIWNRWGQLSVLLKDFYATLAVSSDTLLLGNMLSAMMDIALPAPVWLAAGAGGVLTAFISLTYAQAVFVAIDEPRLSLRACMRRSRQLMQGRRGERLMITLSFIPWFAPVAVSLSLILSASIWAMMVLGSTLLLAIWAVTYRNVTYANYYSLITGQLKRQHRPGILSTQGLMKLDPPPRGGGAADDSDADSDDAPPGETEEEARQRLIDEMWKR